MITVVNLHKLAAGWETNPQYVYCGRAGRGQQGVLGNPIILGARCLVCGALHTQRTSTLTCYEFWARTQLSAWAYELRPEPQFPELETFLSRQFIARNELRLRELSMGLTIGRHQARHELLPPDQLAAWIKAFHQITVDSILVCFCAPQPCHADILAVLRLQVGWAG